MCSCTIGELKEKLQRHYQEEHQTGALQASRMQLIYKGVSNGTQLHLKDENQLRQYPGIYKSTVGNMNKKPANMNEYALYVLPDQHWETQACCKENKRNYSGSQSSSEIDKHRQIEKKKQVTARRWAEAATLELPELSRGKAGQVQLTPNPLKEDLSHGLAQIELKIEGNVVPAQGEGESSSGKVLHWTNEELVPSSDISEIKSVKEKSDAKKNAVREGRAIRQGALDI